MTCWDFKKNIEIKCHTNEVFNHFKECIKIECFNIYLNGWMWLVPIEDITYFGDDWI